MFLVCATILNKRNLSHFINPPQNIYNICINIHLKDRPLNGTTVPLGEGDTNFSLVFRMLKEYDYHGNLILQTARAKDNDHLGVLKNYHNIIMKLAKKTGLPVNID